MTTHVSRYDVGGPTESNTAPWSALCATFQPGDVVVTLTEAHDPAGRHFDCVECHRILTGSRRHSTPTEG